MKPITYAVLFASLLLSSGSLVAAQQTGQPKRVGVMLFGSAGPSGPFIAAVRDGLREQGFVEGENVVIEPRYAEGKLERLGAIADELAQLPVDVIVTVGTPNVMAAKKATQSIPIVVPSAGSPAETGLVTPGGNVTGFDVLPADLVAKQIEVLREVVPTLSRLALVWNGSNPAAVLFAKRAQAAAAAAGMQVIPIEVQNPGQLEAPLAGIREKGAQAIFVAADSQFFLQRKRIGELTTATGLPTLCPERAYGDAGCLIAYGANTRQMFRQSASYVAKILKGGRPADLPIGLPARFEIVIHAGSAKAMGLTIPTSLISRADAVVQ